MRAERCMTRYRKNGSVACRLMKDTASREKASVKYSCSMICVSFCRIAGLK